MSYYSLVEISYRTEANIDVDDNPGVRALTDKAGYSLNDLRDLFEDGRTEVGGHSDAFIQLVSDIAKLYREVDFMMRFCGEELADTALREFKNGQVVFEAGPWSN